mmetsp:Transcript_23845/g.60190  ORF Transcript_23845/g.60190 Transcript_23845/m.60190 type:complete len:124 (-) Transcript_23845:9-380(-)
MVHEWLFPRPPSPSRPHGCAAARTAGREGWRSRLRQGHSMSSTAHASRVSTVLLCELVHCFQAAGLGRASPEQEDNWVGDWEVVEALACTKTHKQASVCAALTAAVIPCCEAFLVNTCLVSLH